MLIIVACYMVIWNISYVSINNEIIFQDVTYLIYIISGIFFIVVGLSKKF